MASCKFEGGKCKGGIMAKAYMRHNDISPEMRKIAKKKNKHIDLEKCKYNFSLLGLSYEERCTKYDDRITFLDHNGNTNKRRDRITMQCIEIPVPQELPRDRYHDWFIRVAEILCDRLGDQNLIDADFHYDEEHWYRESQTNELVLSRVHGHYMFVPEVNGKLNAKQISLRKNMKSLNQEVEDMTQKEFNCAFMTGKKTKSLKKVEELKQESENAELLYQMDQELDTRKAALDAREADLDARDDEQEEKAEELEQREMAVKDLEEQKEELHRKQEAVRKKEAALDEAVKAVTEMPTMDDAVEYIMDHATIEIRTSPESPVTFPFVARRYLDHIRYTQKKEAENIRRKARKADTDDESGAMQLSQKMDTAPVRRKTARKAPEYAFSGAAQPDDGMEY